MPKRHNAALLAARLSGRPLLMRDSDALAYGRQLLNQVGEGPRTGFAGGWLAAARRAVTGERREAIELVDGPDCYYPLWLARSAGEPDGAGFGWTLKSGVALVEICGPLLDQGWTYDGEVWINGYDTLSETFAEIAGDPRVQAVFVRYDTPGGMATDGLPVLAAQIRALRAVKPVWAWCAMAASAGYWIASANSRVLAPGLGMVGSIGAVITHCDLSGMLEKDGLTVTQIQFGAKKTDGSPYKPLSDAAKADLQAEIDDLGALFVANVLAGRPALTAEGVIATQAACFAAEASDAARSGLQLGLVDAIMDEGAAFSALVATLTPLSTTHLPPAGGATALQEPDMKKSEVSAALAAAGFSAEQIKRAEDAMPADDPETPAAPDQNDDDEDEDEDAPEAMAGQVAKITASAEAKAHPTLALTAIQTGQTFAQFQATCAAVASLPKGSRLDNAMSGARRLSPDAPKPGVGEAPKPINATSIYAQRNKAMRRGARG